MPYIMFLRSHVVLEWKELSPGLSIIIILRKISTTQSPEHCPISTDLRRREELLAVCEKWVAYCTILKRAEKNLSQYVTLGSIKVS